MQPDVPLAVLPPLDTQRKLRCLVTQEGRVVAASSACAQVHGSPDKLDNMPCGYLIDQARLLVLSTAHGVLTYEELKTHQNSLRADPAFEPRFNQLWDFTQLTGTTVTPPNVRDLAIPVFFSPESRRAFVITHASPQAYGLLRMWETYHEIETGREQTAIFPDVPAALRWLESGSTEHERGTGFSL